MDGHSMSWQILVLISGDRCLECKERISKTTTYLYYCVLFQKPLCKSYSTKEAGMKRLISSSISLRYWKLSMSDFLAAAPACGACAESALCQKEPSDRRSRPTFQCWPSGAYTPTWTQTSILCEFSVVVVVVKKEELLMRSVLRVAVLLSYVDIVTHNMTFKFAFTVST